MQAGRGRRGDLEGKGGRGGRGVYGVGFVIFWGSVRRGKRSFCLRVG